MNSYIHKESNRAFTIIELLIVIVIIAILVAITAVSYNGITKQVNQTATDVDIANMKKSLDMHMVTRKVSGELTQAEKDKIYASFSGKSHFWDEYYNDVGSNSQFMKRGEYLINAHDPKHFSDGTFQYTVRVVYWDYQENKWVDMYRTMNSATGERVDFHDNYYNFSNNQTPCREQYFGRCYVPSQD